MLIYEYENQKDFLDKCLELEREFDSKNIAIESDCEPNSNYLQYTVIKGLIKSGHSNFNDHPNYNLLSQSIKKIQKYQRLPYEIFKRPRVIYMELNNFVVIGNNTIAFNKIEYEIKFAKNHDEYISLLSKKTSLEKLHSQNINGYVMCTIINGDNKIPVIFDFFDMLLMYDTYRGIDSPSVLCSHVVVKENEVIITVDKQNQQYLRFPFPEKAKAIYNYFSTICKLNKEYKLKDENIFDTPNPYIILKTISETILKENLNAIESAQIKEKKKYVSTNVDLFNLLCLNNYTYDNYANFFFNELCYVDIKDYRFIDDGIDIIVLTSSKLEKKNLTFDSKENLDFVKHILTELKSEDFEGVSNHLGTFSDKQLFRYFRCLSNLCISRDIPRFMTAVYNFQTHVNIDNLYGLIKFTDKPVEIVKAAVIKEIKLVEVKTPPEAKKEGNINLWNHLVKKCPLEVNSISDNYCDLFPARSLNLPGLGFHIILNEKEQLLNPMDEADDKFDLNYIQDVIKLSQTFILMKFKNREIFMKCDGLDSESATDLYTVCKEACIYNASLPENQMTFNKGYIPAVSFISRELVPLCLNIMITKMTNSAKLPYPIRLLFENDKDLENFSKIVRLIQFPLIRNSVEMENYVNSTTSEAIKVCDKTKCKLRIVGYTSWISAVLDIKETITSKSKQERGSVFKVANSNHNKDDDTGHKKKMKLKETILVRRNGNDLQLMLSGGEDLVLQLSDEIISLNVFEVMSTLAEINRGMILNRLTTLESENMAEIVDLTNTASKGVNLKITDKFSYYKINKLIKYLQCIHEDILHDKCIRNWKTKNVLSEENIFHLYLSKLRKHLEYCSALLFKHKINIVYNKQTYKCELNIIDISLYVIDENKPDKMTIYDKDTNLISLLHVSKINENQKEIEVEFLSSSEETDIAIFKTKSRYNLLLSYLKYILELNSESGFALALISDPMQSRKLNLIEEILANKECDLLFNNQTEIFKFKNCECKLNQKIQEELKTEFNTDDLMHDKFHKLFKIDEEARVRIQDNSVLLTLTEQHLVKIQFIFQSKADSHALMSFIELLKNRKIKIGGNIAMQFKQIRDLQKNEIAICTPEVLKNKEVNFVIYTNMQNENGTRVKFQYESLNFKVLSSKKRSELMNLISYYQECLDIGSIVLVQRIDEMKLLFKLKTDIDTLLILECKSIDSLRNMRHIFRCLINYNLMHYMVQTDYFIIRKNINKHIFLDKYISKNFDEKQIQSINFKMFDISSYFDKYKVGNIIIDFLMIKASDINLYIKEITSLLYVDDITIEIIMNSSKQYNLSFKDKKEKTIIFDFFKLCRDTLSYNLERLEKIDSIEITYVPQRLPQFKMNENIKLKDTTINCFWFVTDFYEKAQFIINKDQVQLVSDYLTIDIDIEMMQYFRIIDRASDIFLKSIEGENKFILEILIDHYKSLIYFSTEDEFLYCFDFFRNIYQNRFQNIQEEARKL